MTWYGVLCFCKIVNIILSSSSSSLLLVLVIQIIVESPLWTVTIVFFAFDYDIGQNKIDVKLFKPDKWDWYKLF